MESHLSEQEFLKTLYLSTAESTPKITINNSPGILLLFMMYLMYGNVELFWILSWQLIFLIIDSLLDSCSSNFSSLSVGCPTQSKVSDCSSSINTAQLYIKGCAVNEGRFNPDMRDISVMRDSFQDGNYLSLLPSQFQCPLCCSVVGCSCQGLRENILNSVGDYSQHCGRLLTTLWQCLSRVLSQQYVRSYSEIWGGLIIGATLWKSLLNTMEEPSQIYGRAFLTLWKSLLNSMEEPSQHNGIKILLNTMEEPSQHFGRAFSTLWTSLLNTMKQPSQHFRRAFFTLWKSLL